MRSMTGFGRASAAKDGREITVEMKSVNHRYLDIAFRMPRNLSFLEDPLRRLLQKRLVRGHVEVFATYRNDRRDARRVVYDEALFEAYLDAFRRMEQAGLRNDVAISAASRLPDLLTVLECEEDQAAVTSLCERAAGEAIDRLVAMSTEEGERLRRNLEQRIGYMETLRQRIETFAPKVVLNYKDRLTARLSELLGGATVDENRLCQELALFADKASIDEELVRLGSHFQAILSAFGENGGVGRKADFLVQEMNREVNTIGSKASDTEIIACVVELKTEIEKLREQVQNIE